MRNLALLVSLILLPGAIDAQTAQPAPGSQEPHNITKIIRVRYGNPEKLAGLVRGGVRVSVSADNALQAIVLNGPAAEVAAIEATIRELDVPVTVPPSRDVELIVSILGASDKPDLFSGGELPEALAPVVKQLRAVFPYKNYQSLGSMLLRSREEGKASENGVMQNFASARNDARPGPYSVYYESGSVSSSAGTAIVHVRNFRFNLRLPISTEVTNPDGKVVGIQPYEVDVTIQTDVDLREGQKVVVGKANVENGDSALFVVLSARLVD